MKKDKQTSCPGCGRHCTRDCVRCKYGRNYFAKLNASKEAKNLCRGDEPGPAKSGTAHRRKWEKYVSGGGEIWQLLHVTSGVKKALRHGKTAEDRLLSALDGAEREQLAAILKKLEAQLET